MQLRTLLLAALVAALAASPGHASCETYWLPIFGKGEDGHVQLQHGWPLLQFVKAIPDWDAGRSPSLVPNPPPELKWRKLDRLASLHPVGELGRHTIYWVDYGPGSKALVWEDGDWSFCPLLLLDLDTGLVAGLHGPEIFTWEGRAILTLRIFIHGMGAIQESLFFAEVEGSPVHLRHDLWQIRSEAERQGVELYHRGGGFCQGTLVWTQVAWSSKEAANPTPGTTSWGVFWVEHAVDGNRLVIRSAELVKEPNQRECALDSP